MGEVMQMLKHAEGAVSAPQNLKVAGVQIVGVEQAHGATLLQDWKGLSAGKPVALVFGNEVTGVSEEALALCDACVEIPQFRAKHSFNISVGVWEGVRDLVEDRSTYRVARPF